MKRNSDRALPRATYRLQLHREFTLRDAARVVPHLAALGISHVYTSPLLKARPGSLHGYDVVDHTVLNPELGTPEDFDRFVATLHEHGLGLIVDIVPNHLGVMGDSNPWWLDVLENGPAAQAAANFDIDWRPNRPAMRNRLLVAVLGAPYGAVLERGEIKVTFDAARGEFSVRYHEHCFPLDPREYPRIFAAPGAAPIADEADRADFESLLNSFGHLPPRENVSEAAQAERYRDKEAHKRRFVRLIERSPAVLARIEAAIEKMNGVEGQPESFDALDGLLEAQAYRLAYWRVAVDEINYRRFFDVNDLAALRMDKAAVFEATHALILEWVGQGKIDGLRIDHSDGLYDPEAYFARLQQAVAGVTGSDAPFYVVTEKILATHENLPRQWQVQGTTGYEFGALATTWLVDPGSERVLSRFYGQFTGEPRSFEEIACLGKKLVMRVALSAEVEVLATQFDRIAQLDRHTADFTRPALRDALIETIASFPVYRTYVSDRGVQDEDKRIVHWAIGIARKRSLAADVSVFDFLRDVLLGDEGQGRPVAHRIAMLEFAMKFQQVTSPVTAKGVEDTALYRYNRLLCLNEVGGDPRRYGISPQAFHQSSAERMRAWPNNMLASSTHDSKRGEDVRARLAVLSEVPDLWKRHVSRWARLNRSKRRLLDDGPAPSRNDEYLLYQTLLGVWDAREDTATLRDRLQAYMVKATREAKISTSWLNPNPEYEQGVSDFVAKLLDDPERSAFLHDFRKLAQIVEYFGRLNSLVQVALKIAAPGVPDFYQGTEVQALTLVDPDNRRAVDFDAAQRELDQVRKWLRESPRDDLLARVLDDETGRAAKLLVTSMLLELRKEHPQVFAQGRYEPIAVTGERKEHLLAFARVHEGKSIIVVVPRWMCKLSRGELVRPVGAVWGDARLQGEVGGSFVELFSDRKINAAASGQGMSIAVADALARFPIAVLVGDGSPPPSRGISVGHRAEDRAREGIGNGPRPARFRLRCGGTLLPRRSLRCIPVRPESDFEQ
jgi:(1->4)-alpha-D-glucan 1-alpha-D-glucosylmutase